MDKNKIFLNLIRGAFVGLAEIIPGISGSTIALIMGIYDDFVNLLDSTIRKLKVLIYTLLIKISQFIFKKVNKKNPNNIQKFFVNPLKSNAKVDWSFGLPFLIGIVSANLVLANIISYLFSIYPNYIQAFFFGLVVSTVYIPVSNIKILNFKNLLVIFAVSIFTFWFVGLMPNIVNSNPSRYLLFFSGILGVTAMILPGVSGAFILLVLGVYEYIINLVKNVTRLNIDINNLLDLLVFFTGLLFGLAFVVRFVKYAFLKYPDLTFSVLAGLMIGSVRAIYPFYNLVGEVSSKLLQKVYYLPWDQSLNSNSVFIIIFILLGVGFQFALRYLKDANKLNINPTKK